MYTRHQDDLPVFIYLGGTAYLKYNVFVLAFCHPWPQEHWREDQVAISLVSVVQMASFEVLQTVSFAVRIFNRNLLHSWTIYNKNFLRQSFSSKQRNAPCYMLVFVLGIVLMLIEKAGYKDGGEVSCKRHPSGSSGFPHIVEGSWFLYGKTSSPLSGHLRRLDQARVLSL